MGDFLKHDFILSIRERLTWVSELLLSERLDKAIPNFVYMTLRWQKGKINGGTFSEHFNVRDAKNQKNACFQSQIQQRISAIGLCVQNLRCLLQCLKVLHDCLSWGLGPCFHKSSTRLADLVYTMLLYNCMTTTLEGTYVESWKINMSVYYATTSYRCLKLAHLFNSWSSAIWIVRKHNSPVRLTKR